MNDIEFDAYRADADRVRAGVARDLQRVSRHAGGEDPLANVYHMTDANLRWFFPQLAPAAIRALIAEILYQQRMALRDQQRYGLIERTRIVDDAGVLDDPQQPRVYCTYHAGSYRHLLHFLGRRGIDCLLYLAGRTRDRQGGSFVDDAAEAAASAGWRGRLTTLDADNPSSLLHGVRALRRGTSIVIYIDGNSGSGSAGDHTTPVPFFGRTLRARSGVAYLSHLAHAPVVPALCRRADDASLSLHLQAPIAPRPDDDRATYAAATTQMLYARLADAIADAPGQWEGWLYVHKQLQRQPHDVPDAVPVAPPSAARWTADQDRYAVLRFVAQAVLLDKARHSCTLLDHDAEAAFHAASNGATIALDADGAAATVRQLLTLGALRPADTR